MDNHDKEFRCGVLIPAYQPDEKLLDLLRSLEETSLTPLVVDDGSTNPAGREIFSQVEAMGVTVLHHPVNQGKGQALKTGIAWLAERGFDGVVTADSDGQHTAEDIARIAGALAEQSDHLILGVRELTQMPPKSRTGNTLTKGLFRALYGIRVSDTQTGLRGMGLGEGLAEQLLALYGQRYEFEMEMLIDSPRLFAGIREIPIQTVYIDNNAGSHFRPIQDGAKIYARLLRRFPMFLLSSLLAFGVDYALFNALYYLAKLGTVGATVSARVVSAGFNYLVNRHLVFRGSRGAYSWKNYFLLAAAILAVNVALVYLLVNVLTLPAYAAKLIVECVLYIASFAVQSRLSNREK